jgi:hypothetical protein
MPPYDIARFRALEISQDLGDAKHAHGQHGKIDAVREIIKSQRETFLAGLEILTDCREQQTQHHHDDGLEHGAARQHDREPETKHHQTEILGGPE